MLMPKLEPKKPDADVDIDADGKGKIKTEKPKQDKGPLIYIVLSVAGAAGIRGADKSGTSDAYALLKFAKAEHKTAVISKTLAPQWNESFMFAVRGNWKNKSILIEVWDHNKLSKHEFLGAVEFKLTEVAELKFEDVKNFTMDLTGNKATGAIAFSVSTHEVRPNLEGGFALHRPHLKLPSVSITVKRK